jgi:hypothetical protein
MELVLVKNDIYWVNMKILIVWKDKYDIMNLKDKICIFHIFEGYI